MASQITGVPQLIARLHAVQAVPPNLMADLAISAVQEMKLLVPRKTANLAASIGIDSVTPTQAIIVATANYAAFVEFDTAPHDITPNAKKALAWVGNPSLRRLTGSARTASSRRRLGGTGTSADFTFATIVHHPGTNAQPFMYPGAEAAIESFGLGDRVVIAWNGG